MRSSKRLALLASVLLSGCALEIPPHIPRPELTRSVVMSLSDPDAVRDPAACPKVCATPQPLEELTSCHLASMDAAIVEHRAALGETPSEAWVVCTYSGEKRQR